MQSKKNILSLFERDIASRNLGIEIKNITENSVTLTMKVIDSMIQGHGVCHGGYLFLLADTAMAFASSKDGGANLAMHANIDFVRPALKDQLLTAVAKEVVQSKRTGLYDVRVYNDNESLVCHFRGRAIRATRMSE